jgi:hypothetical protein
VFSNPDSPSSSTQQQSVSRLLGIAPTRAKGKTRWVQGLIAATRAFSYCAVIRESLRDHDRAPRSAGEDTAPWPPVVRALSEQIATTAFFGAGATLDNLKFEGNGDRLIGFTVHHKLGAALTCTYRLRLIQRRVVGLLGGDWITDVDHIAGTVRFTRRDLCSFPDESVRSNAQRKVAIGQLSDAAAQQFWSDAAAGPLDDGASLLRPVDVDQLDDETEN